jgi:hypothetical protein
MIARSLSRSVVVATLCVLSAVLLVPSARAGLDVDFGATVRLDDDADLYFAVSSRYFDRDRDTIERWGRRYEDPDDLAVALFISRHAGVSLKVVFDLRRGGRTWWDVGIRVGVPTDVWFVPIRRDPGPPYGKAYGHWKNHKHDRRQTFVLFDSDIRNLIAVKMMHDYYGVSVELAMDWRSSGRDLRTLVSDEYRGRHGKDKDKRKDNAKASSDDHPGKGKGKNKN